MRPLALLLAVSLAATPAWAEPPPALRQGRGLLTGLGFTLLVTGVACVGLGLGGTFTANDAAGRIDAYSLTTQSFDGAAIDALRARLNGGTTTAVIGFTLGAVALIGGALFLALDAPPARVAFVPTSDGGTVVLTGRF